MSNTRSLWLVIAFLGVLNLCCLAFIFFNRPAGRPERKFDEIIIRDLALDEAQVKEFEVLKRAHREQMDRLDASMQQPFEQYFGLLTGDRDLVKEDSLRKVLSLIYGQKVGATYAHFEEIKALCRPDQRKNIHQVVPFLMQVISPPKKYGPGRGK